MTRGHRLTFLAIAAVVAVILLAGGSDETDEAADSAQTPTPDIKKELEPNKTETVSFNASITGIFEIGLEGSATQLASLKVLP